MAERRRRRCGYRAINAANLAGLLVVVTMMRDSLNVMLDLLRALPCQPVCRISMQGNGIKVYMTISRKDLSKL